MTYLPTKAGATSMHVTVICAAPVDERILFWGFILLPWRQFLAETYNHTGITLLLQSDVMQWW